MATRAGAGRRRFLGRIPVHAPEKKPSRIHDDDRNISKNSANLGFGHKTDLSLGWDSDTDLVDQLEQLEKEYKVKDDHVSGQSKNKEWTKKQSTIKIATINPQISGCHNPKLNRSCSSEGLQGNESQSSNHLIKEDNVAVRAVKCLRPKCEQEADKSGTKNTAQNIEVLLERGGLDLSSLTLDSPLHVSTPADTSHRSTGNQRGHGNQKTKKCLALVEKVNLFQQLLNVSDNLDIIDDECVEKSLPGIKCSLQKSLHPQTKHKSSEPDVYGDQTKHKSPEPDVYGDQTKHKPPEPDVYGDQTNHKPPDVYGDQTNHKPPEPDVYGDQTNHKPPEPDVYGDQTNHKPPEPDGDQISVDVQTKAVATPIARYQDNPKDDAGNCEISNHSDSIPLNNNPHEKHVKSDEKLHLMTTCQPSFDTVPVVPVGDRLKLSAWGLPDAVLSKYKEFGIDSMFEWQAECLCTGNVLNGGNLVYSAPTSAGKTLVAELLMLKRIMETKKKAIVILPFVSVAREKMFYFQNLFQDVGLRVEGYMGSISATGGFSTLDVAVCTIEKANSLINRLMEEGKMGLLGMIVVDELHMVGDSHRGYLLELLLTKVQFIASKLAPPLKMDHSDLQTNGVQIIGMSATLPNLDLLAKWLNADLYHTDFRPVPLMEMMKVGSTLYDSTSNKVRALDMTLTFKGDDDGIIPLCLEVIRSGHSVLIFCPTKNWCEQLSNTIAKEFYGLRHGKTQHNVGFVKASYVTALQLNDTALKDVLEQLKRTPVGIDNILGRVVPQGVAFHHAGLTFDERDIIEGAFRQTALRVLVATSTLSSGVNLPARRVIIRTPIFHRTVIDTLVYKQMVGRAGRKGVDTYGESVLVCKANEKVKGHQLMQADLPPVHSCLIKSTADTLSSSMKRAILEVVVSGVASTPHEVAAYANCTMLAASMEMGNVATGVDEAVNKRTSNNKRMGTIEACIDFLVENELISLRKIQDTDGISKEKYLATNLGSAVLASALSPDEGLTVFTELQKARRCFVLENDLHVIYLVTPIYMADQWGTLDWYKYLCYWEQLSTGMKRVAELVGVSESFLNRAVQGRIPNKTAQHIRMINIQKRFYTALVLHDLVNECPLPDVATKYGCTRGVLQSLQQGAATFSGMVTVFCNRLGWTSLELLLEQFQSRLTFGVQRELVDLVRLTMLNAQRARALYNGGIQTVAAISNADAIMVEKLLKNAVPFQSKKMGEGETKWEAAERQKSRCIFVTGHKPLTEQEAAILIIEEAHQLLKADLEQMGVQWTPQHTSGKVSKSNDTGIRMLIKSPNLTEHKSDNHSQHTPRAGLRRRKRLSSEHVNRSRMESTPKTPANLQVSILSPPPAMNASLRLRSQTTTSYTGDVHHTVAPPAVTKGKSNALIQSKQDQRLAKHASVDHANDVLEKNTSITEKHVFIKPSSQVVLKVSKNASLEACESTTTCTTSHKNSQSRKKKQSRSSQSRKVKSFSEKMNEDDLEENNEPQRNETKSSCRNDSRVTLCNSKPDPNDSSSSADPIKNKQQVLPALSEEDLPSRASSQQYQSLFVETKESTDLSSLSTTRNQGPKDVIVNTVCDTSAELYSEPTDVDQKGRPSVIITKSDQYVMESLKLPVSDPLKMIKAHVKDTSAELYSEPMKVTSTHNIINDSFMLDTQTLNLIAKFSPSADVNTVSGVDDMEVSLHEVVRREQQAEGVHVSKLMLAEGTPSMYSDLEHDSTADEYMNNYCTQGPLPSVNDAHHNPVAQSPLNSDKSGTMSNISTAESMGNNKIIAVQGSSVEAIGQVAAGVCHDTTEHNADNSNPDLNGAISEYDSMTDVTSGQDEAMLCCSDLEQGVEEQHIEQLLPASCYDKQAPPTYDREEQPDGSDRMRLGTYDKEADPGLRDPLISLADPTGVHHEPQSIINNLPFQSFADNVMPINKVAGKQLKSCLPEQLGGNFLSHNKTAAGYGNLDEDLEIAMNMSDSFTCSVICKTKKQHINDESMVNKIDPAEKYKTNCDKTKPTMCNSMGQTSLTLSILQRELDSEIHSQINFEDIDAHLDANHSKIPEPVVLEDAQQTPGQKISAGNSVEFSPEMTAILDAIYDDMTPMKTTKKKAPKRKTKGRVVHPEVLKSPFTPPNTSVVPCLRGKKRRSAEKKSEITPTKLRRSSKSMRMSTSGMSDSHNESAASDCVPPTPPRDDDLNKSKIATPQRLLGGVVSTPQKGHSKCKSSPRETRSQINTRSQVKHDACLSSEALNKQSATPKSKSDTTQPQALMPSNMALQSPTVQQSLPFTNESFTIIDVAASKMLFEHFIDEWKSEPVYALCVACEKVQPQTAPGPVIGGNFKKATKKCFNEPDGFLIEGTDLIITGIAVSWNNRDAYYVALTKHNDPSGDPDDSLCPPPLSDHLPVTSRLAQVKAILESPSTPEGQPCLCMTFDLKEQFNALSRGCGIWVRAEGRDPKVATWLLNPEEKERNLHRLVHNHLPLEDHLLEGLGGGIGVSSLGLTPDNPGSGRVRAAVEAVLVRHLVAVVDDMLRDAGLWNAYEEVEMPSLVLLTRMELNGIGFSQEQCETQKSILQAKMSALEDQAYNLAGHTFSLTSTDDISQILFFELKLPPSGDVTAPQTMRTLGPRRGASRGRARQFSTSKDVLEKLANLHPLPGCILEWRRINGALTKVVFPYQKVCVYNRRLCMHRVHSVVQIHTATGRVSMTEPNVQNIPRDFEIELPSVIEESPTDVMSVTHARGQHSKTIAARKVDGNRLAMAGAQTAASSYSVSMRHAFVPFQGGVMLAADYSQLELRILAHLSGDKKLRNILNSGGDVFKTIASQWKGVEVEHVSTADRQQAKQVCYGMIYGIGPKALGEQIGVNENDAAAFMETFKAKYTGMRTYLRTTVQRCREMGYVTTLSGRRRYLPAIKDTNPHSKAHAERQAVNTSIQGSAADLVKKAMVKIDKILWEMYPDTRLPHRHKTDDHKSGEACRRSRRHEVNMSCPRGAYFILQLHDELIYEVNEQDIQQVAQLVKDNMESAMMLSVHLPVKVKVGPTWGSMEDMTL